MSRRPASEGLAQRLQVYPAAVLLAFAAAFALRLLSADGIETATGRIGGDFPAFYGAGALVRDGRADALYDWSAQAEAQVGIHPDAPDAFMHFAYPPYVAGAYSLLARLDYVPAYAVHTGLMALCLLLAVTWIAPALPRVGSHRLAFFAAMLAFYPMLRAVSGQNTALSALLVAGVWRALVEERDWLAGLSLGLLLYKPQLALPLGGLIALGGRPRVLLAAALPAAGLYAGGAAVAGWAWLPRWWQAATDFHVRDQVGNASHSVGILGAVEAALGPGEPAALLLGGVATLALVLFLAWTWLRGRRPLDLLMGLTCCGLALVPPHSMYYEAGLAGFGLAVLVDRGQKLWPVAALYLLAYTEPLSEWIGVNPLFAVVCATALLLARAPDARPRAAQEPGWG